MSESTQESENENRVSVFRVLEFQNVRFQVDSTGAFSVWYYYNFGEGAQWCEIAELDRSAVSDHVKAFFSPHWVE